TLRRLLIFGSSAIVLQASKRGAPKGSWLEQMLARKLAAGSRMYNTPNSDVVELTQVVGSCNKEQSHVVVPLSGRRSYKTPIQCDKGALLQGTGNRWQVAFGYGNNSISFAGVYNKDDNSIVVNQLWPGPTPVDALKNAIINGVIENHLEGKCLNQEKDR